MSVPVTPQAQENLGTRALVLITAWVDEGALLLGPVVQRGWPEGWHRPLPRHGTQRGRSWGRTAGLGRADSRTEGAPRKGPEAPDLKRRPPTLSRLTTPGIAPLDLRDARGSQLLQHVSQKAYGYPSAQAWQARSRAVYDVAQAGSRGDAPPVPGAHEVPPAGLGPCGPSKDDPPRPQSQGMLGS